MFLMVISLNDMYHKDQAYGKTPGTPQERKSGGTDSYDALWFTV